MDDWPHYMHSLDFHYTMTIKSPDEAMQVFDSEFEAMYENGGMLITVWHPFVSGRLARMRRVAAWIEALQKKGGVWFATMDEIARHVRTCIDDGSWKPRVEQMPYYDGRIPEWEPQEAAARRVAPARLTARRDASIRACGVSWRSWPNEAAFPCRPTGVRRHANCAIERPVARGATHDRYARER